MKDITIENFETEVIGQSGRVPVLVDFWATWCGPCRTLGPILEKLEADYAGRFVLAKIDSDKEGELAQAFGVRSIPTVVLMKNGQPVDGFVGALPEGQIRQFLDKHLPAGAPAEEEEFDEAAAMLEAGDTEGALEQLGHAVAANPADDGARYDYVKLLAEAGRLEDARYALSPVQDRITGHVTDQRFVALDLYVAAHEAVGALPDEGALAAKVAADPRDFASAYALAQHRWVQGEPAAAMDALLEIIRRDRGWQDGLARRTYIAVIELLNVRAKPAAAPDAPAGKLITNTAAPVVQQDPLIGEYRRKLSMALF